jgi:hypothetical protein
VLGVVLGGACACAHQLGLLQDLLFRGLNEEVMGIARNEIQADAKDEQQDEIEFDE